MPRMLAPLPLLGALLALGGCVLPEIELEGRACPCVDSYVCVNGVCVVDGTAPADGGEGEDAAVAPDVGPQPDTGLPPDSGPDAGPRDVEPMDAPADSGPTDGPVPDTGPADAGGMDAEVMDTGEPPVPCATDRHCGPPNSVCNLGFCVAGCGAGGDACTGNLTCDVATGHCFNAGQACTADSQCGGGPPQGVCVDGQCAYGCAVSSVAACTGDQLCGTSGFCEVSPRCIQDVDCGRTDFICQAGTCIRRCDEPGAYPCAGNSTCNTATGLCDGGTPLGQDCTSDAQCISGLCLSLTAPTMQSFCTRACGSTSDCPLDNSCQFTDGAKLCVRESAYPSSPPMDTPRGQACSNPGNTCQSLVCANSTNTCVEMCSTESHCDPTGDTCIVEVLNGGAGPSLQLCGPPVGALPDGVVCANNDNSLCASGVCNRYHDICAGGCCNNADCPSDQRCTVYDFDSATPLLTCQPVTPGAAALGVACGGPGDCDSGVCAPIDPANLGGARACTAHCCRDQDCAGYPGGARCAPMPAIGVSAFVNYCVPR